MMESMDSFLERLAQPTAAPGGGAASASVTIIASSLVSMVAGLTVGKKGYENHQEKIAELLIRSKEIRSELRRLMEEDENSFGLIVSAWKLPKNTEEEKNKRSLEIAKASLEATKAPWKIASTSQEVLRQAALIARIGIKSAATDAGCALEFSMAAIKGALENIKINLKSVKDEGIKESENMKMRVFMEDSETTYREGLSVVEERIA
ncbi:MAG: cyclodeaminase/cyclohydrolase family protein [Thermoplasmatales archaeon]|nr:cyclodeaminase/cyclohydrolase family protein [Thermoplasmatales archaeon]